MKETYCGTMAFETEHISNHEERVWLRKAIESATTARRSRPELLARLVQTEGLEQFLHRTFLGQKQFSIEGLDVLIPMLDEAIDLAADGTGAEVDDRHGPSRAPQRPRAHDRGALRGDPARFEGSGRRGGRL